MSSKLVKGDTFQQTVPHRLTVLSPIHPDDLLCHITVLVNKHTRAVELSSVPGDLLHKEGIALDVLQLGIQRIKDIHTGRTAEQIVLPQ